MQLERAVGNNEKLENSKLENLKLEIFHLSWKVPIEVGKFSMKTFSNFGSNFPTSFFPISPTSFFPFPTALFNYMHPKRRVKTMKNNTDCILEF